MRDQPIVLPTGERRTGRACLPYLDCIKVTDCLGAGGVILLFLIKRLKTHFNYRNKGLLHNHHLKKMKFTLQRQITDH